MKIIVFNDTSSTDNNPGCKATMHSIMLELGKKYPGADIKRVPLGYGYKEFQELKPNRFLTALGLNRAPNIYKDWKRFVRYLITTKEFLTQLQGCQKCIINMEGTIHHNNVGALVLLGIARAATEIGVPVSLLNGTIQEMDKDILRAATKGINSVLVREAKSSEFLSMLEIPHIQGIDFVFNTDLWPPDKSHTVTFDDNAAFYTGGVKLAYPAAYNIDLETIVGQHVDQLRNFGFTTYYLQLEENEQAAARIAEKHGSKIIDMSEFHWSDIKSLLERARLVVSGRYHINLFCLILQKNFIPMESNSWKTEGVFDLLKIHRKIIPHSSELTEAIIDEASKSRQLDMRVAQSLYENNVRCL